MNIGRRSRARIIGLGLVIAIASGAGYLFEKAALIPCITPLGRPSVGYDGSAYALPEVSLAEPRISSISFVSGKWFLMSPRRIWTSIDLTSWKEIPAPDGAIADITWAGSAWIAVGWSDGNGRVWVSTNLQSWRQVPVVLPGDLESSDFESIDHIAGEWRILGEAQEPGANTYPAMWRTQDLVNFSVPEYPIGRADYEALGESEATRDYLTDVASQDGKTVIIHRRLSDGRLRDRQFYAFSRDGFSFKRAGNLMQDQQSEEIFAVAALKGRGWLAVGTRKDYPLSTPVSALFSTSGIRWDSAGTIVGSPEVRTIYDLAVSPKEIVMIGEPSGQDDYRTWLWTLNVDPCKHS